MYFASLLTKQPHMLQKCAPSRAAFVLVAQPYAGCLALARGRAVAQPDCTAGMAMICVFIDFTSFLIIAVASGNRKSRHFKINSEVTALSIAGIRVPEMKKAPSIYTVCYIKFIFNYSN